jgi:ferric-dicitrate binding protein FerR (iron transport regulator)
MSTFNRSRDDLFWSLLAKKIAGEATADDLRQYQDLLLQDLNRQQQADIMLQIWQQRHVTSSPEAEAAYIKHLIKNKAAFLEDPEIEELPVIEEIKEIKQTEQIEEVVVAAPSSPIQISMPAVEAPRKAKLTGMAIIGMCAGLIIAIATVKLWNSQRVNASADNVIAGPLSKVSTGNGNRTKLLLPDGTQVWLNAGSRLDYNASTFTNNRQVVLNGEAYFEVTNKSKAPFYVYAKHQLVEAADATNFNINVYGTGRTAETSVLTGLVAITLNSRADEVYKVHESEKLVVDNLPDSTTEINKSSNEKRPAEGSIVALKKINRYPSSNLTVETGWVNNKLVFMDKPFSELALQLERWYDIQIQFENNRLLQAQFTGAFENEPLGKVLSTLQSSIPFKYNSKGKKVRIR